MNFYVPDVDIELSDLNDPHSMSLPKGRGEAVPGRSDPFCDQGEEYHLSGKQQADTCVSGNRGNWMEIHPHEKHAHVFEAGQESALAIDVPLSNSMFQDDEMLSWLQYPLDDAFSKSYCSGQLCEPSITPHPVQGFNLRSISQDENVSSVRSPSQFLKPLEPSMEVRTVMPDTAMALGAHQAAGPLPQAGADVFSRVHVSRKSLDDASSVQSRDNVLTFLNVVDNRQGKQNAKNFSFFSQHVDAMKTSLQVLVTSSGPSGKERLKQPLHTHSGENMASVEQSRVVASLTSSSVHGDSELSTEWGKELMQGADTVVQQKLTDCVQCNDEKGEASVETNVWSAVVGSGILETGDVTLTSLSDGSDDSAEKTANKGTLDFSCKRKPLSEEFECDSKDAREASTPEKCLGTNRVNAAKRRRAAEIHNQSERRRRDKINAKMRALQELIPNANKTDKASMLDEAIEYVKMLQAQLQLMSMRTGLPIPSLMMPPGMQYLSAQQKPGASQVTIGKEVGTGLVMDASSSYRRALQRPAFLGQPLSGQDCVSQWYQPSRAASVMHGVGTSLNLTDGHAVSASQQRQPLHAPRTVKTYKSSTQEQTDSGRQHH